MQSDERLRIESQQLLIGDVHPQLDSVRDAECRGPGGQGVHPGPVLGAAAAAHQHQTQASRLRRVETSEQTEQTGETLQLPADTSEGRGVHKSHMAWGGGGLAAILADGTGQGMVSGM